MKADLLEIQKLKEVEAITKLDKIISKIDMKALV